MFLSFLLILSHAVVQQCIAPSDIPQISSSFDIIQYQIIINSGSHSPKNVFLDREKRGFWYCDSQNAHSMRTNVFPLDMPRSIQSIIDKRYSEYPPNCFLNDLTVEGMNELYSLGLNYRKYLLSIDSNYLNDSKISQKLKIRATNDDNSFRNAISFLTGLFNNEKVNDLDIITGTKNKEIIVPDKKYCKDVKDLISKFESSDECQEVISEAKKDLQQILQYLNYTHSITRSKLINVCDFILSMYCNEQVADFNLTDDIISKVKLYYSELSFGSFLSAPKSKIGVAASTIMREILRTSNETIEGKNSVKFSLFSAEDSTIAAILSLMKQKRVIIPFASHMSIAILKKKDSYYVQIALNGNPLVFPTSEDKVIIPYGDFCNYVNNYIDFCHELP